MGEQNRATENAERAGSGGGETKESNGLVEFGRNFWSKTREVTGTVVDKTQDIGGDLLDEGQKIGGRVVDEIRNIDTDELARKGKDVAQDGIDIYQGDKSTGNGTVDSIIEIGKGFNPFKGVTDAAADLGEKGMNGEITQQDLEEAARGASKDLIPVPESVRKLQNLERIGDQTGLSDPVKEALRKATEQDNETTTEGAQGESEEMAGLPKLDLIDGAKKAGSALDGLFKRVLGNKENQENKD